MFQNLLKVDINEAGYQQDIYRSISNTPRITSEMLIEASRATRYNEACHFCSLKGSPFRIKVEN